MKPAADDIPNVLTGYRDQHCKLTCTERNKVNSTIFSELLFYNFLKYNTKNWTHLKRRHFSYIIYDDNSMNISVIMLYHRLPKPFLACSVPQLQLKIVRSILEIGECFLHKNKPWLGKRLLDISQPKIIHKP